MCRSKVHIQSGRRKTRGVRQAAVAIRTNPATVQATAMSVRGKSFPLNNRGTSRVTAQA